MNGTSSCGGVVLAGGVSQRMGQPKAWLPLGEQTLLWHVVATLREVLTLVVVVRAASNEPLPPLPPDVKIVCDRNAGRGPLEGLAVGLATLSQAVPRALVTGCDGAWLTAAVVRRLAELSLGQQTAVPWHAGHWHVLLGVYDTSLEATAQQLLDQGNAGPVDLLERAGVRRIEAHELVDVDPELDCLRHVNTPKEYQALCAAWEARSSGSHRP